MLGRYTLSELPMVDRLATNAELPGQVRNPKFLDFLPKFASHFVYLLLPNSFRNLHRSEDKTNVFFGNCCGNSVNLRHCVTLENIHMKKEHLDGRKRHAISRET